MASLNRHLLESGDHRWLAFHPRCPVCRRERLLGALPHGPLFSHRARALLASGALAFSAAAPGVAVAGDPDRQQEGVVAPDQPNADAPGREPGAERPGYDPGGDTSLPYDTGPEASPEPDGDGAPPPDVNDGSPSDDAQPLEAEPVQDPDAPPVPLDAPGLQAPSGDETAPVAPIDAVPLAPAPSAPEGSGSGVLRDAAPAGPPSVHGRSLSLRMPAAQRHDAAKLLGPAAAAPSAPPPAAAPTETVASSSGASAASLTADVRPGARVHVVREGESLWSIAAGLLGPRASASAVAREVARLWALNEDRIGTGDPDLLPAGTRLLLR